MIRKGNIYRDCLDHAEIIIYSKRWGTKFVMIDKENVERCKQYTWYVSECKENVLYVYSGSTNSKPYRKISLHRFLTDCPKGLTVDHINRNTFDNRLSNLRVCNQTIQNLNQKISVKNKSGYRNICFNSKRNCWRVTFTRNKKSIQIGAYKTLEEAIKARDKYLKEEEIG